MTPEERVVLRAELDEAEAWIADTFKRLAIPTSILRLVPRSRVLLDEYEALQAKERS